MRGVVSHYPNLKLAINYITFPQVESVLSVMVTGKQTPCLCLDLKALPSNFLPYPVDKGE